MVTDDGDSWSMKPYTSTARGEVSTPVQHASAQGEEKGVGEVGYSAGMAFYCESRMDVLVFFSLESSHGSYTRAFSAQKSVE